MNQIICSDVEAFFGLLQLSDSLGVLVWVRLHTQMKSHAPSAVQTISLSRVEN